MNLPGQARIGTVGPVLPGTEVKIAEDGEILIKGPGVMKGYWQLAEQTAQTIIDGWLHTGDIGEFRDGYLAITDRKKDIIVTAGGKNIAPQKLEGMLASSPYLAQVVVHGDARKYLVALATLDLPNVQDFAQAQGFEVADLDEAASHPKVVALVQDIFESVNADLARYETIKYFKILPVEFQIGDELTPKMSVKRKVVEKKFSDKLDEMYQA